jgi:cytochrome c-type biogenesis protein CcmH
MIRAARVTVVVAALASGIARADETRLQRLAGELRCPVCQNQSLADSNADLARDLRNEIARQLAAGRTDAEVRDFMVSRYGDFVLYDPPLQAQTWVLWIAPFAMLAAAAGGVAWRSRGARAAGRGGTGHGERMS